MSRKRTLDYDTARLRARIYEVVTISLRWHDREVTISPPLPGDPDLWLITGYADHGEPSHLPSRVGRAEADRVYRIITGEDLPAIEDLWARSHYLRAVTLAAEVSRFGPSLVGAVADGCAAMAVPVLLGVEDYGQVVLHLSAGPVPPEVTVAGVYLHHGVPLPLRPVTVCLFSLDGSQVERAARVLHAEVTAAVTSVVKRRPVAA